MTDDPEGAGKQSFALLVSRELFDDSQIDLLGYLSNPAAYHRNPVPLTRRRQVTVRWFRFRVKCAEAVYKLICRHSPPERDWEDLWPG